MRFITKGSLSVETNVILLGAVRGLPGGHDYVRGDSNTISTLSVPFDLHLSPRELRNSLLSVAYTAIIPTLSLDYTR